VIVPQVRDSTVSLTPKKLSKLTATIKAILGTGSCAFRSLHKLKGLLQFVSQALAMGKPLLGQMDDFIHKHCNTSSKANLCQYPTC
jgi:hypothetical protein